MASMPFRSETDRAQAAPARAHACPDGIAAGRWHETIDAGFTKQWQALSAAASEPNPFYDQWLLRPALEAFDPTGSVQLVQFYADGELCGLIPLKMFGSYYGYPIPHLRGWLHDNAFCGLPLVKAGHERSFWTALLDWASATCNTPLFLHLCHVPQDCALYHALHGVVSDKAYSASIVLNEDRAILKSELGPDAYFEGSMSGKKRKELRRQERRLSELGGLHFDRCTADDRLHDWIEDFLALEKAGWKGREGSALASDRATAGFFRESLKSAAQEGTLERLSLALDGRPIAMLANFLVPPAAFSFKTAFDEDFARFSPGVLLQRHNLAILDRPDIDWTDSCAAADHPMIERIWREKRTILRVNIGIGGRIRQAVFNRMTRSENGAKMMGSADG